jgi:hypothetical protein
MDAGINCAIPYSTPTYFGAIAVAFNEQNIA